MPASIKFVADASSLKSEATSAAESVNKVATAAELAREKVVASFKMQIQSAKEFGASQRELESISRSSAKTLSHVTDDNAERYVRAMDRMEDRTRKFNEARRSLAMAVPIAAPDDHQVSRQAQASASLRALGGTPSIRAAESWASSTPLAGVFAAAFPIVGAVAFTAEVARGVEELVKMTKEARELPEHIRDGFNAITSPMQLTGDTLRVTNDELEITIAKLEHKPANTLALALDEARVNADNLASSAQNAYLEVKKLLDENQVGIFAQMLGQGDSGGVSDEVEKRFRELRDLQRQQKDAVREGKSTTDIDAQIATARTGFRSYLDAQIKERTGTVVMASEGSNNQLRTVSYAEAHGDQSANLNILSGAKDILNDQDEVAAEQKRNKADQIKAKQLEAQKAYAAQMAAAQQKAFEDTKKEWDSEYAAFNSNSDKTLQQERQFWYDRLNSVQQGSLLYAFAQLKANELLKQINDQQRRQIEEKRKIDAQWQAEQIKQLQQAMAPAINAQGKGISAAYTTGVALSDAQRSAGYAQDEASVSADEHAGRLTKLDAAMQIQILHSRQCAEQLAELKTNLDAVDATAPDAEAQRNRIRTQITDLTSRHDQETTRYNASLSGSSGSVGFRDALNDFVISSRDAASQMRQITDSVLNGINQNLSAMMVGGKTNWAETFRGVGQQIGNAGLKNMEGSLLGKFGLGKADGSRGNPFHVIVDTGLPGGFGVGGKVPGGGDWMSDLFGAFTGRAVGGDVDANSSYLVGERGPELLTMGSQSGRITPNNKLGGGVDIHFHPGAINASGATDPAAVDAAVRRGIAAAAPQIVASSVSAVSERNRRLPSTRRT